MIRTRLNSLVFAAATALLVAAPAAVATTGARPSAAAASSAQPSPVGVVRDDTGAVLRLRVPARRIVSLAPGATEMLFAAGAGERIVATVTGADEPAAAKGIPRIGDANAIVFDRLRELRPDAVVIWKDLTNELIVDSLVNKLKLDVYFVSVRSLADIPQSVRRLGVLAGTQPVAERAARAMEANIARLPRAAAPGRGEPLDVFFMIWDSPLYTVGSRNVVNDAIARCGGRNIYGDIDFPAPIVEFEDLKKRNPDVILMSAPPITARDWRERWSRFPGIAAVENRRLLAYPDLRLTRMGPSAIDAVPQLCELLAGAGAQVRR